MKFEVETFAAWLSDDVCGVRWAVATTVYGSDEACRTAEHVRKDAKMHILIAAVSTITRYPVFERDAS